jgi:hypothetical protein
MCRKSQNKHSSIVTSDVVRGVLAIVKFIMTKGGTPSTLHILMILGWMNRVWFLSRAGTFYSSPLHVDGFEALKIMR